MAAVCQQTGYAPPLVQPVTSSSGEQGTSAGGRSTRSAEAAQSATACLLGSSDESPATSTHGEQSSPPSTAGSRKRPMPPPTAPKHHADEGSSASSNGEASASTSWHRGIPRRLLHLFSGPGNRMDGLKQMMLDLYNLEVIEVDTLISEDNDLTNDEFYEALIQRCRDGEFFATIIGTPCGTFSVARIRVEGKDDDGPPQLRSEAEVLGISSLSPFHRKQVEVSDLLVKRSVAIARAVKASGGQFIIENPITRSDPSTNHYRWRWRSHASLWMHPEMKGLLEERSTRRVDFHNALFPASGRSSLP